MNKYIKFVISALMIAAAVYLMMNRNIGWGIVLVILSAVPIFLYFKNEYILLAFWQLRKQNMEKAGLWLRKITNYTSQLDKNQYGYFHYLQGLTLAQDNPTKIEPYMKKALDYGLNMKHDRAMATLNLAAAALSKGRKQEGQKLLEEAKRLDTAGMMTEHIKTMKAQLKMPTMQKHVHNPHMRQRGKF
ncbi:hypothetical protein SAMN05421796_11234 [Chryseobacterium piscicola]|uniref:DUF2892 domain-containing protein n=1 Tax=Chryseobacterium piscicola TaxID=551459 RepID=A0A1N7P9Q2_9FLAO|nr:hypothetical protein [Chryseobacterium piscicola]PQA95398.1 hypothetical protein B0A70_06210 [Chryseobacterium piscicola]SIT07375.1 hypothetical protein SAMN05421796_11234 [Chryseobacterium piscicola]